MRSGPSQTVVAVLGPTATGKSTLALALAHRFGGEIVNCDSTAVYRGFDIGTDKVPSGDREGVPHHLIGEVPLSKPFDVGKYREMALERIEKILARGRVPIVCGGTGLYVRALTHGLARLPPANPERSVAAEPAPASLLPR